MSRDDRRSTGIRFAPDLHDRLMAAARERDLSVNFLVNRACEAFLDDLIPADEMVWTRTNPHLPDVHIPGEFVKLDGGELIVSSNDPAVLAAFADDFGRCGAYYGKGGFGNPENPTGIGAVCSRPAGHPSYAVDGIGHCDEPIHISPGVRE